MKSKMNSFMMLVKREFWEYRAGFLYMPFIIVAFTLFLAILGMGEINSDSFTGVYLLPPDADQSYQFSGAGVVKNLADLGSVYPEQRELFLNSALTAFSVEFMLVLGIVLIMYFINSLYQDRKDRSILFWKSMPVSDALTVASKLVAGLVLVPLIYFVCMMLTQLLVLLCVTLFSLGMSIDIWATLWAPANLFSLWIGMFGKLVLMMMLYLPLTCWILLVSAGAKSSPLAWLIGVPAVLIALEANLMESNVIGNYVSRTVTPFRFTGSAEQPVSMLGYGFGSEFIIAMLISVACVVGAIVLRRKASDL